MKIGIDTKFKKGGAMKKLKILSVGCEISPDNKYDIKDGTFCQKESFSEYDVLIIDPIIMDKLLLFPDYNLLDAYARRRPEEIKLLLERMGGIAICFLREWSGNGNRYTWFPQKTYSSEKWRWVFPSDLKRIHRMGCEVKHIDKTSPFSQYFEAFKNEISFEVVFSGEGVYKVIAEDRGGDIIACELPFGPGKFIFLPPLQKTVDKDKFFGVLLDCIKKSLEWTESLSKPIWLKKYPLDKKREKEIEKGIDEIEKEIEKMSWKKQELEDERKKFELLKSLLYEQHKFGLEPPVREAFRILGFNVLDPDDYDERYDLYIKEGELSIIGEITGSIKPIAVEKMRELHDYISTESIDKKRNCKGILIGNAYIEEKEPNKRPEQFTADTIRGCKLYKYCRMTTYELFKGVKAVLCNPSLKQSIKEQILNCESEFKL